jgi:hypothetical protein
MAPVKIHWMPRAPLPPENREEVILPVVARCNDADRVNALANAPEIRPFIGGEGELDLSDAVDNPLNLFLLGEHGGFALIWSAPGAYEVHTFVRLSGRGAWARQAARDTIRLAAKHGADRLWTRIVPEQANVVAFAREMGMRPRRYSIVTLGKAYDVYSMEIG